MMIKNADTPILLLDKKKCLANIEKMVHTARQAGVALRPHFKTHQSQGVGRWYREFGIRQITVSSFRMAEYFANDGWTDITVAFPVNVLEMDRINQLADRINLNLLVENQESVELLTQGLTKLVPVFINIDMGYHRSGLGPDQMDQIEALIDLIQQSEKLAFKGFLGHAGHSYNARGSSEIEEIHHQSLSIIQKISQHFRKQYPDHLVSVGDTPTTSLMSSFPGAQEIRPGNGVFYDLSQWRIGSCRLDQIAVAMLCPVVAKHPDRQEIVLYGGGVHFSKDRSQFPDGTQHFGMVVSLGEQKWEAPAALSYLRSLSQEHGIVKAQPALFEQTQIGDRMAVLPVHSCMAANLMKVFYTLDGQVIRT